MTKLPDGWELKRLSDCLEKLKSGKKAERGWSPQCLSHPSSDENVWGVLKTTSVQMGEFQPEYNKELPDSLMPKSGLEVNSGDFLVTTTGPRNRCGIVCHVKKTRKKLIFSGKILRFRVNESLILPNWLMYLLMSPEYQSILDKMKVGTSDSSVSIGNQQILDLEIPVPPIYEQHKIVEILEDHLSRLDAALADVKQAKIKAAQFRRSLLQTTFKGNLDADGSRSLAEWRACKLSDVVELLSGFAYKSSDWQDSGVPVLKITNVRNGRVGLDGCSFISTKLADDSVKFQIKKGDLLVTLTGEIGATGFYTEEFEARLNQRVGRIIPKNQQEIDLKYIAYFLESPQTREIMWATAKGVAQANISPKEVLGLEISLPPIEEQYRIVELLEGHLSHLGTSTSLADDIEEQAKVIKRSLLQAAFTGHLTNEVSSV